MTEISLSMIGTITRPVFHGMGAHQLALNMNTGTKLPINIYEYVIKGRLCLIDKSGLSCKNISHMGLPTHTQGLSQDFHNRVSKVGFQE